MGKSKINYEEKLSAIMKYKQGKGSYESIAKIYGISKTTLLEMVAVYDSQGEVPFDNYIKIDNTNLSAELVAKMIKEQSIYSRI